MTNLIWYTAHALRGERVAPLGESEDFGEEVARFHDILGELATLLTEIPFRSDGLGAKLLQGPLSDGMTHVGELALLRRLAGAPIPAEDFFGAPSAETI